ncbi:MAG: hypothetical protein RL068_334 [Actinomycetota bacterium]|jgi:hypothetical protein
MQVFRSRFTRVSTVVAIALFVSVLIGLWVTEGFWAFAISVPPMALVSFVIALLYWFPRVEVDEGGVRLVNVLRTHYVSWGAIELIDTKYALTLQALGKRYTAWAAPAPGRHSAVFASKDQGAHLPESTYLAGTVRPGDLITSDSGAVAAYVRRIWEQGRDKDQVASVHSQWQVSKIVILLTLTVATAFVL